MTAVRVAVYAPDATTLLANVRRRRNVRWQDEKNAPGSAGFDMRVDDPLLLADPNLLDPYNVVKFYLDGDPVKAWIIEDTTPTRVGSGGNADRWVSVVGRGPMSALEAAVIYPEGGMKSETIPEDRYFNFSSEEGLWYDASEWEDPVGVRWEDDTTLRENLPRNWPDPDARWLWSDPGPAVNVKPGRNWFRSTITVTENTPVVIYATADNVFTVYLDGNVIMRNGPTRQAYRTRYQWHTTLTKGDHVLAASVTNLGDKTRANNKSPAGYIATIYRADASGKATADHIWRTLAVNTKVKAYGDPPGWHDATILQQLVTEAQDRNVDALLPITFDFDNDNDSDGLPWDDVRARKFKVGTTDLMDLANQLIEMSFDMEVDADFVMHCWKDRGADLSASVILREGRDVMAAVGTRRGSRVRNQALLKYPGGWVEIFSAASKDVYGRREVGLSVGNANSLELVQSAGTAALREVIEPEVTIPVTITSVSGPQPYKDFNLGDRIMVPDVFKGLVKARLMSITAAELGEGNAIQWDLDFYPHTADDDDLKTITRATGGEYDDISELYRHEVLSDSPWGYWRMNDATGGTFKDYSGHKRHLKKYGTPALAQPGPVDLSAFFGNDLDDDGNVKEYASSEDERYKVGDTAGIVTVEAWINITSYPGEGKFSPIIAMADSAGGSPHDKELYIDHNGTLRWRIVRGGDVYDTESNSNLNLDRWYHVAASVGTRGRRLYIDGDLVEQHDTPHGSFADSTLTVFVRNGGAGHNDRDQIYIAEAAVYFQQLFDSRIRSHYRAADYTP